MLNVGWLRAHAGTARLAAAAMATAPIATLPAIARRSGSGRLSARPARMARAGAIGSRYWKPLTGHSVKKSTGTTTHASSMRSARLPRAGAR